MIYDEDPFRRRPENRWPGENDKRGLSEWRKIWPNGLPDEGQIVKSGLSDGRRRDAVTLAVERWYDFHGFRCHLGNVG